MIVITQLDGGEEMNTKVGFEKKKKRKTHTNPSSDNQDYTGFILR